MFNRIRKMVTASTLLIAASMAGASFAAAPPAEDSMETTLGAITLPANANGTLELRKCRACPTLRLTAGPGTQYLLGRKPATLAEVRAVAAASPQRLVLVFWDKGASALLRVRL